MQIMNICAPLDKRVIYDPHAGNARAYLDLWGAGIEIHTWTYIEEMAARVASRESSSEVSVWVSNRMRDDIERAIMVLGLKGEYL